MKKTFVLNTNPKIEAYTGLRADAWNSAASVHIYLTRIRLNFEKGEIQIAKGIGEELKEAVRSGGTCKDYLDYANEKFYIERGGDQPKQEWVAEFDARMERVREAIRTVDFFNGQDLNVAALRLIKDAMKYLDALKDDSTVVTQH